METPGRPILYGMTNEFLERFGLRSLEELPKLKEFKESDLDFIKEEAKGQVVDTDTWKLVSQEAGDSPKTESGNEDTKTAQSN